VRQPPGGLIVLRVSDNKPNLLDFAVGD